MAQNLDVELSAHTALAMLGERRQLDVTVKPYAGLKAFAELSEGEITLKVSEGWAHAPEEARVGLVLSLLTRLLRRRPSERERRFLEAYREFSARESTSLLNDSLRRQKGRSAGTSPSGDCYDLEAELGSLLSEYSAVFNGALKERPRTAWSRSVSRARLGFHDSAFNILVVSKALDSPRVPKCVVRYVLYHELLHAKHKVLYERGESLRRTVHPRAFKQDERKFAEYHQATDWLKRNRL